MRDRIRYLLLQVRDPDDPMRGHEVDCFSRTLHCPSDRIEIFDLLSACPTPADLDRADVVLLGGSGDYSVAEGGDWMTPALEAMRELHELEKPTFASCWGFQAMARALGGVVVTDVDRAEVGTRRLHLTEAGRRDPVFGPLGASFFAQMGHQDIVDELPDGAVLLASTDLVENQAFCFPGKPIYCTQFHPELSRAQLLDRLRAYPKYVEHIAGMPYDEFEASCRDSVESEGILCRFVDLVVTHIEGVA